MNSPLSPLAMTQHQALEQILLCFTIFNIANTYLNGTQLRKVNGKINDKQQTLINN